MLTGLEAIFFYLFAFIAIAAAFMVISARNPVHSVLWLILTFFNAAALFLLTGAEFLAMILLVVYVGAVAVLFLFVVMMLDVDFAEFKSGALQYAPIGALVGYIVLRQFLTPELMGILFAAVAGVMVYISLDELLPTSRSYGKGHDSLYGLMAGMAVMALSLLLL